ncbi:hypothetical protein GCM10023321_41600 [Pseudonocardia eucalypti]|uniref:DUF732 domain-containing protein n=1 Tax=Pseudonocardia eucalypti TaxID=648755 RepID=A0ABP9QD26_9PSEU|nr:hypothetical protein [Pseudonocardia eucalypti]
MTSQTTPMFPKLLPDKARKYVSALAMMLLGVVTAFVIVGIANTEGSPLSLGRSPAGQEQTSGPSPTEQTFLAMARNYGLPVTSDSQSLARGHEVCRVMISSGDRKGRILAAGVLRPDLPSGSEDRFVQVVLYSGLCTQR